jgi:thioesterase domain-containing protein
MPENEHVAVGGSELPTPIGQENVALKSVDEIQIARMNKVGLANVDYTHPQAPIHRIQNGKNRPIFLLHGNWTGGVPFYCYAVARTLGKKQTFYALDPYKYQGPYKPINIDGMAAAHIQSMKQIQPEGPYVLGGFCNGSLIAYEIARQLQAAGEQVDALILIAPTNVPRMRQRFVQALHRLGSVLKISPLNQMTLFLRVRHAARHVYKKLRGDNDARVQDFPKLLAIDERLAKMFPVQEALLNDYVGVFTWLASLYQKRYRPENVHYIWASEELESRQAWSEYGGLEQGAIVPGYHMDNVTHHVDILASEFKACIDGLDSLQLPVKEPATESI